MTSTALIFPGRRVDLAPTPPVAAVSAFEVGFIGYCPAGRSDPAADRAVEALGLVPTPGYFHQPVPVEGWDAFLWIFGPDAGADSASTDALAGERYWLPGAVADFFSAGGKRAWIVRADLRAAAPEDAHVSPDPPNPGMIGPTGAAAACTVPTLGLICLPDLERLYALPELKTLVPPPVPVPAPVFRPLGAIPDAGPVPAPRDPSPPLPSSAADVVLRRLSRTLATLRPDVTALFTVPTGLDPGATMAGVATEALQVLYGGGPPYVAIPNLQPVLPLLTGPGGGIASPSGLLAGAIAAGAERDGVWRSVAGRPIPSSFTPIRPISNEATDRLRLNGVGALQAAPGGILLETEALAVPFDPAARAAPTRRFTGWLHRQLQQYGESLVFENDTANGHVELMLTGFFADLFRRGALKARRLQDSFSIKRIPSPEGSILFEIRFTPSFAIDTIVLRLVQNADGALVAGPT